MQHQEPRRDWLPLGFFIFGGLVGLLTLAATILMRLELQVPGVQYLVTPAGTPNGELYIELVALHGSVTVMFVMLPMLFAGLGYKFVPEALGLYKTRLRPLGWVSLATLCAGFISLLSLLISDSAQTEAISLERFLYPVVMDFAEERPAATGIVLAVFLLPMLALSIVFVDFLATLLMGGRRMLGRKSVPAWTYVLAGLTISLIPLTYFIFESVYGLNRLLSVWVAGNQTIHLNSLDLALAVVSFAAVISSLWVGFVRGREYWIIPLLWASLFLVCFACGRRFAHTLSTIGITVLNDTSFITGFSHALVHTASIAALAGGMYAAFVSIGQQVRLGAVQVTLMTIGSAMTIFPFIYLGWMGFPRRYIDFAEAFEDLNRLASYGTYLTALAMSLWIVIVLRAVYGNGSGRALDLFD